jgi:hypothetical protein
MATAEQLAAFNQAIAAGDYATAGSLASSAGYNPEQVAGYLNTSLGMNVNANQAANFMPTNLAPSQVESLQGALSGADLNNLAVNLNQAAGMLPDGYSPLLGQRWENTAAEVSGAPATGYVAGYRGPADAQGMYNEYDAQGNFIGRFEEKDDMAKTLAFLATIGGAGALFNSGLLGGAGAAGAEAGASAFGNGAWLGEGIASGVAPWDAAALSAGNTVAGASASLLDAQFIAADAAQLAAQTGGNVAAIQQNLIAAGVDPIVAAAAADAAALGVSGSNLITTIAEAGAGGAGGSGLFTGGTAADLAFGGINTVTGNGNSVGTGTGTGGGTTGGGGTGGGTGGGGGTTTGGTTGGLTTGLTGLLTNPNTLKSLLSLLGASGLGSGGGGGGGGVGQLPTQGIPQNTPEYFNQVQGFLNQYLPGQLPNQAGYLQSWYGSGGNAALPTTGTTPTTGTPQTGISAPGAVTQSLWKSLSNESPATDIISAYAQFTNANGGDTPANRLAAIEFLRSKGISDAVIGAAYDSYLSSFGPANYTNLDPASSGLMDIVNAYAAVTSAAGGDTEANRQAAIEALRAEGFTDDMIGQAYQQYLFTRG